MSPVNNGQSWVATSESPQIYQRTSANSFMLLTESAKSVKNLTQYQFTNDIVFEKLIFVSLFNVLYMVIFFDFNHFAQVLQMLHYIWKLPAGKLRRSTIRIWFGSTRSCRILYTENYRLTRVTISLQLWIPFSQFLAL